MTLLNALTAAARQNRLVLLIGSDLDAPLSGAPSRAELARGMADEFGKTAVASLAAVADQLAPFQIGGYLDARLTPLQTPGPLYTAVANLPLPRLITTAFDHLLETALKQAGREPNLFVVNPDLNRRRLGYPDLLKLCGDIAPPLRHTLMTRSDQVQVTPPRVNLFTRLSAWLQGSALLMLGCDPAAGSDFTQLIFPRLLQARLAAAAGAWLLWPDTAPANAAHWQARGVTVATAPPLETLQALAAALAAENVLFADPEAQTAELLAQTLSAAPDRAEFEQLWRQLPAAERPHHVRVALELWLDNDQLHSKLNIDPTPHTWHFHSRPRAHPAITPDMLTDWVQDVEDQLELAEAPQGTAVEDAAITLFDELVPDAGPDAERRKYFSFALFSARQRQGGLDLALEIKDADRIGQIPWELLYDKHSDPTLARGFWALEYPVYRLAQAVSSAAQVTGTIRKALIVAADPTATLGALQAEVTALAAALEEAGIEVRVIGPDDPEADDPQAIADLLRSDYQLLHFTGHGRFDAIQPEKSYLLLGQAQEKQLTAEAIGSAARDGALILAVLSACSVGRTQGSALPNQRRWLEAGIVDALARSGVPATLGMRWKVGEQNALALTQAFYAALLGAPPRSVQQALMQARQAIRDQADWVNPILTKLHGVLELS